MFFRIKTASEKLPSALTLQQGHDAHKKTAPIGQELPDANQFSILMQDESQLLTMAQPLPDREEKLPPEDLETAKQGLQPTQSPCAPLALSILHLGQYLQVPTQDIAQDIPQQGSNVNAIAMVGINQHLHSEEISTEDMPAEPDRQAGPNIMQLADMADDVPNPPVHGRQEMASPSVATHQDSTGHQDFAGHRDFARDQEVARPPNAHSADKATADDYLHSVKIATDYPMPQSPAVAPFDLRTSQISTDRATTVAGEVQALWDAPKAAPALQQDVVRRLRIELHPEALGQLHIDMLLRGKELHVKIEPSNKLTETLLRRDQDAVAKLLKKAGYELGDATITITWKPQDAQIILPETSGSSNDSQNPSGHLQREQQHAQNQSQNHSQDRPKSARFQQSPLPAQDLRTVAASPPRTAGRFV